MSVLSQNPAYILRPPPTKDECDSSVELTTKLSASNKIIVNAIEDAVRKHGGQFLLTETLSDFKTLPFVFEFLNRKAFTVRIEHSLELKTKALVQLMRRKLAEKLGVRFHDIFLHPTEDDKDIQKETTLLATILHDNPVSEATRLEEMCASDGNMSEARLDLGHIEIVYKWKSWNQLQPVLRLMVSDFDDSESEAPPTVINGKLIEHSVLLNAHGRYKNNEWLKSTSNDWHEAMAGPSVQFGSAGEDQFREYDSKIVENPAGNFFQFRFLDSVDRIQEGDTCISTISDEGIVILVRIDRHKAYFPKHVDNLVVVPAVFDARPYRILLLQSRKKEDLKAMEALSEIYERPKPTIEEKSASEVVIAEANSDIQTVAHELSSALEDMGGDFILTKDKSGSDLKVLPYLFTTQKPKRMKFTMTFEFEDDQAACEDENAEQGTFVRNIKEIIAKAANLEADEVVIHKVGRGSTNIEVSIPKELDTSVIQGNFKHAKISALAHGVNLVLKLSVDDFDPAGDMNNFHGGNFIRGGMPYHQPSNEWRRIGLRVKGQYDNGDDDWLRMNGNPSEWAVGFHGCRFPEGTKAIAEERVFKAGALQAHCGDIDTNKFSANKGSTCGKGAYFANNIKIPETDYGLQTKINNEDSVLVFQVRLNPKTVQIPNYRQDFYIAPDIESARPYGICIKKTPVADTKKSKSRKGKRIASSIWRSINK